MRVSSAIWTLKTDDAPADRLPRGLCAMIWIFASTFLWTLLLFPFWLLLR